MRRCNQQRLTFEFGSDSLPSPGGFEKQQVSAKRHGHEPYAYLRDVLERLPAMKSSEIDLVLPRNWKPAGEPAIVNKVA